MTTLRDRGAAALVVMRRRRCTHLLVSDPVDARRLSGFPASRVFLLLSSRRKFLCADFRYAQAAEAFCRRNRPWKFAPVKGEGWSFLARLVPPGSRLGFQSDVMTVLELRRMRRSLRRTLFVPIPSEISALSAEKTPVEIAAIAAACRIGDAAFARFRRWLRPGTTELMAARELDRLCAALGSEKQAFDTIMLFGPRTALPHGRPGGRRLRRGDFVLVDFGCTVGGFCSDMTRTMVCGSASPGQRRIYRLVLRAQEAARAAAKAGMAARALDAIARGIIATAGFGKEFGHGLGHGVGLRIHEAPRISSQSRETLRENSTVTIEPGIYISGFGGVRIEDTVILTKKGCRTLTETSRTLVEL